MAATPHIITSNGIRIFTASFGGLCVKCGEDIIPGEAVGYISEGLAHEDCGFDPETTYDELDNDTFNRGREPRISVIPRGKTKADMCQRCFQIPSSNSTCGCDG